MKSSFAVLAAFTGAAVAQNLGSCAQLCADNMARIANTEFSCAAGDTACFCSKSNWAYGIRDCSAQACDASQASQAVNWANGVCQGAASQASGTELAAIPILTSAIDNLQSAGASATGSAGSAVESVTGSAGSAVASATESAASAASSAAESAASGASSALESASSAAASAASSASGALNSLTGSLASRVSSATGAAGSGAPSSTPNAAPMITGMPLAAGAGLAALFLL